MKKRMLIGLLLTAALVLCAAPVFAEGAATVEIGGNGDMLALLEPRGDKTMMQWIKYWHENGAPEYIGYLSRFFWEEDVQVYRTAVDEYYTDIQAAWDGVDLRDGEISDVPECWVVAMKDDTAENRAALAALPSNPCIFKFIPADISFNDVLRIYSEVADYARYRLPVYSVEIRCDCVDVVVSAFHYDGINQRLKEKYGDHVNVISNESSSLYLSDQYINWPGNTEDPASYELFLLASAAMLALTLLAGGITALITTLIRKIKRGKRDGSADAAAVPKKRLKGRRVFLIVIAAELAVIACAWGVMKIIDSKSYSERPVLNTDSRVQKLADYGSLEYTKTGDAERDGRTALLQATADSNVFSNHCDLMYIYKAERKRITAAAQALGIDTETYYQTVVRPQLLHGERAYDSYEIYLGNFPYDELRIRIVTEAIAAEEGITVTQEDISQAGAKLGYSAQDLTEASAALNQATAKALQEKVAAFLLKNG